MLLQTMTVFLAQPAYLYSVISTLPRFLKQKITITQSVHFSLGHFVHITHLWDVHVCVSAH